jgi:hypothetical protein
MTLRRARRFTTVNHYGQLAMEHWRAHRQGAFRALPDPNGYFEDLGEEVQAAITSLRNDLIMRTPTRSMIDTDRRARQAHSMAEEIVLTELVWRPEEPTPSVPDPILDQHYRMLDLVNGARESMPTE